MKTGVTVASMPRGRRRAKLLGVQGALRRVHDDSQVGESGTGGGRQAGLAQLGFHYAAVAFVGGDIIIVKHLSGHIIFIYILSAK